MGKLLEPSLAFFGLSQEHRNHQLLRGGRCRVVDGAPVAIWQSEFGLNWLRHKIPLGGYTLHMLLILLLGSRRTLEENL
jgi:hypothetical protein